MQHVRNPLCRNGHHTGQAVEGVGATVQRGGGNALRSGLKLLLPTVGACNRWLALHGVPCEPKNSLQYDPKA